jgi:hypothetical protein
MEKITLQNETNAMRELKKRVNQLITPEFADVEARALIDVIYAVATPDDETSWDLSRIIANEAFRLTAAYETAFREFAGLDAKEMIILGGKK